MTTIYTTYTFYVPIRWDNKQFHLEEIDMKAKPNIFLFSARKPRVIAGVDSEKRMTESWCYKIGVKN